MKLAFVLLLAIVAAGAVQGMELEPGEPATNPFQQAAAAKETVTAVSSTPLQVVNPIPATPLAARNGAKTVATAFIESDPVAAKAAAATEAPMPPPGAVKSASEVAAAAAKKSAAPATANAATSKAAEFLSSIQKDAPKASLKLSTKWLEKIQTRLDAIRDAQDAAPKATDEKEKVRNRAARLIARQIQKVLEQSAETLKKAEAGKLTKAELEQLTVGKKAAAALAAAAGSTGAAGPQKVSLTNANTLLPPGFKAPKTPSESPKSAFSYSNHANNPKHKLKSRRAKKATPPQLAAKPIVGAPRFQQLPVGVVGDGHKEMLLKTVDAVMSLDNPSRDYKGHVSEEGKLCPTCNEIKYNANSPLSEDDKRLLRKQHGSLPLSDVKLHSQDTLDRATLMVDDAEALRKTMLDKYPPQDSLIQFDIHN